MKFPGAGEVLETQPSSVGYQQYASGLGAEENGPSEWAPFSTQLEWEVARWAKLRGPSSTALSELLQINGLSRALGLSFSNSEELNKIIDKKLPNGLPQFVREEVEIAGEKYEFYHRDILECIRALYGDPEIAEFLVHAPEEHYTGPDKKCRIFSEMNSGKWWWTRQKELKRKFPGVTIIPVIFSSDKTRVVLFGSKTAYPVYMTIGNIPKDIRRKPSRRTHVLVGYLPTTQLPHVSSTASRRRMVANLFHHCFSRILEPLKHVGETGVEMTSGNGATRQTLPLFACFVGDYPEQVLVSGCKTGECPKCDIDRKELGDIDTQSSYRDLQKVLDVLATFDRDPAGYSAACSKVGIKPIVHPFWETLPYSDVYLSLTPDVLHQLYQGVMKHLVAWVTTAFNKRDLDARCRCLPPNFNIRSFTKGITSLSRLTGKEHADMCRILLGLIVDMDLPGGASPVRLIRSTRALLDFLYLAQYPVHTSETLQLLRQSLRDFHANKHIFVELGIREDFNLPKLHSLTHYVDSIELFRTTDNYNTEYTERLHIDLAKDAYRATNHRDEYAQMTVWLERKEKILRHQSYLEWRLRKNTTIVPVLQPRMEFNGVLTLTKSPSKPAVDLDEIVTEYRAVFFHQALRRYLVVLNHSGPQLTRNQVERAILFMKLPFTSVAVYHKLKFTKPADSGRTKNLTLDAIYVRPERQSKKGLTIPARFDTALVNMGSGGDTGVEGYRIGQIRVIFSLPGGEAQGSPEHLAYVEWFSDFTAPENDHGMHKLKRSAQDGGSVASIVPVSSIRRSAHLFPKFGQAVPEDWTSENVLEKCSVFYLNQFSDRNMYFIL
ncbi:hypothetical protein BJ322DRAFT_1003262 [Thelephora terrestris]|uniref:Uncharacterized protein n=1 Tax=Thelephora terrestris TaxID=56493 RepID=A0A9P6HIF7_9AGAM|nr:hypothetical protein BJ322DRAFT_1003262 [Thelephora terrestris]